MAICVIAVVGVVPPVLLTGRKPDDITRPDFLNGPAFALHPSAANRNDQGLAQWMRMPGGPSTRLEGDARATHAGSGAWNSGSTRTAPVK
jgi:hypothetical protein